VQANHAAGFVEHAREHVASRALAVGAGYVDAGVGKVGIAQAFKPSHSLAKIHPVGGWGATLALKHGEPLDEPVAGLVKTIHSLIAVEVVSNESDLQL
jgi:hypothetical protein